MSDKTGNVKLGAAVLGGYVLGRTKKLKAGVRLAMWLAGDTGGPLPRMVGAGRSGINSLASSDEVKALGEQVRGPLAEALQRAAMASLTSRLDRLTTGIQNRTDKLNATVEGTTGAIADTAAPVTDTAAPVTDAASGVLSKLTGDKMNLADGSSIKDDTLYHVTGAKIPLPTGSTLYQHNEVPESFALKYPSGDYKKITGAGKVVKADQRLIDVLNTSYTPRYHTDGAEEQDGPEDEPQQQEGGELQQEHQEEQGEQQHQDGEHQEHSEEHQNA